MHLAAPLLFLLAQAASPAPSSPPSPPPPCVSPAYRQFDFWIGDWDVTNQQCPAGRTCPTSRNRISRILNGCAILEEYETPSGYAGRSLNFHDSNSQKWHQTWIDVGGAPLYLEGGLEGRSMVLFDIRKSRTNGIDWTQRITWTPLPEGRVRQHWEKSKDGGATWENVFDGLYTPRGNRP